MAKCDVLKKELPTGTEGGGKCEKDDFEHPNMLYPGLRNRNDTKTDVIFGRHRTWYAQKRLHASLGYMTPNEYGIKFLKEKSEK